MLEAIFPYRGVSDSVSKSGGFRKGACMGTWGIPRGGLGPAWERRPTIGVQRRSSGTESGDEVPQKLKHCSPILAWTLPCILFSDTLIRQLARNVRCDNVQYYRCVATKAKVLHVWNNNCNNCHISMSSKLSNFFKFCAFEQGFF